jgi:hypothetical protein
MRSNAAMFGCLQAALRSGPGDEAGPFFCAGHIFTLLNNRNKYAA